MLGFEPEPNVAARQACDQDDGVDHPDYVTLRQDLTGTFVTISVMGIIADCRPSGEGGS
jgi:hypothetical protein